MIPRGEARRLFIDAARANGRVVVEHVDAVYRHYTAELPDFSALDAGAFHGNYALRLSRSPNCRLVYAVEGEPRNFARLRQALEASPYGATVRPVEVALQSQAAVRVARLMPSLSHPARSGTMSIWAGSPGVTFGEAVEAPAGTIDSLTARSRWPLAFAVLDMEGAELSAIQGAERVMAADRPVLLFKQASKSLAMNGLDFDGLLKLFHDRGYEPLSFFGETLAEKRLGEFWYLWATPWEKWEGLERAIGGAFRDSTEDNESAGVAGRVDAALTNAVP